MATIEHEKWGRVEGVKRSDNAECGDSPSWWKEDEKCLTEYFSHKGWREVKEEKWKDVTSEYEVNIDGDIAAKGEVFTGLLDSDRFTIAPRHHLPEDVYDKWCDWPWDPNEHVRSAFKRFLKQFEANLIIVQRREG